MLRKSQQGEHRELLEHNKVIRNSQHQLVQNRSCQISLASVFDRVTDPVTRIQQQEWCILMQFKVFGLSPGIPKWSLRRFPLQGTSKSRTYHQLEHHNGARVTSVSKLSAAGSEGSAPWSAQAVQHFINSINKDTNHSSQDITTLGGDVLEKTAFKF